MNIWIVILIIIIIKALASICSIAIEDKKENGTVKFLILLIYFGIAAVEIFWLIPLFFNTIFNYLNIDLILTWQKAFPLSLLINIHLINFSNTHKVTKLWKKYNQ